MFIEGRREIGQVHVWKCHERISSKELKNKEGDTVGQVISVWECCERMRREERKKGKNKCTLCTCMH